MQDPKAHDNLYALFERRFGLRGVVQIYFAWCEVSKAVTDLYTHKGIPYEPYDESTASKRLVLEQEKYGFDMDINSLRMLRQKA